MESPSFSLGFSPPAKKRRSKKCLTFQNSHDSALMLGISSGAPDPSNVVDVFAEPLSSIFPSTPSFLPDTGIDDEDVESAASVANDKWFQNRFNEFLGHINHTPLHPSVFMYTWEELGTDLLPRFFKCLLKKDGQRYPSGSINNLLNACQRILRKHQRSEVLSRLAAGLPILPRLNMRINPLFSRTVDCFEYAMRNSVKEQGNLPRRKVDIFSVFEERLILDHPEHSIHHHFGLQKRWAYFCCSEFIVCGQGELHKLEVGQFSEVVVNNVPTIRYVETDSKNNHVDLRLTQQEDFREPCYSNNPDVVACYQALMAHMPPVGKNSHIFLQPISNPVGMTWYKQNVNVSKAVLSTYVASMATRVALRGDYTNKSCRSTAISRMIASGVPEEVIVTVTGHKNPKSLKRYHRTTIVRHISVQQASHQNVGVPYQDILAQNMDFWRRKNGFRQGGSIILNLSQLFNNCLSQSQTTSLSEESCGIDFSDSVAASLFKSNPARHFDKCPFDSGDHLVVCPGDPVNERWDQLDSHFPLRSHLSSKNPLDSPDRSPIQCSNLAASTSKNRLSRSERNLIIAQKKRILSSHSFENTTILNGMQKKSKDLACVQPFKSSCSFPVSSGDYRKRKESETALMYEQIKRESTCAKAGWDCESILACFSDDLNGVDNVAAAPTDIMVAQPNAPWIPQPNAPWIPEPNAPQIPQPFESPIASNVQSRPLLSSCVSPSVLAVLSAPVLSGNMLPQKCVPAVSSEGVLRSSSVRALNEQPQASRVDQNYHFSGPIQYFFNIGGINYDPTVSIGDFLTSLSRVASSQGATSIAEPVFQGGIGGSGDIHGGQG